MTDPIPPPTAEHPSDVPRLLSLAVSDGDLEAAVDLYEPAALLVLWDSVRAHGHSELRTALATIVAAKVPLHHDVGQVGPPGALVGIASQWSLRGLGPDLVRLDLHGCRHSLVRRSPSGAWRFLLDAWELSGAPPATQLVQSSIGALVPRPGG